MTNRDERTEESLRAAVISLLAEGVAVTLFLSMLLLWAAIYSTGGV